GYKQASENKPDHTHHWQGSSDHPVCVAYFAEVVNSYEGVGQEEAIGRGKKALGVSQTIQVRTDAERWAQTASRGLRVRLHVCAALTRAAGRGEWRKHVHRGGAKLHRNYTETTLKLHGCRSCLPCRWC